MVKETSKDRGERSDRTVSSRSIKEKESSRRDAVQSAAISSTKKLRSESADKGKVDSSGGGSSTTASGSKSKTVTGVASASGSQTRVTSEEKPPAIGKKELYEKIVEAENADAKRIKIDREFKEYLQVCKDIEDIMTEIYQLKISGKATPETIEDKKTDGLMLLMQLRRMNRLMKLKLKSVKEDALNLRQQVDSDHLLLQNLLYEATHLNKQVAAVQDYKGADEKIDLIPEKQFFEEAPAEIAQPELSKKDPHLLRIARLEYEFMQRQKLTEQIATLEKEKEVVGDTIEAEQSKLDNLRPMLSKTLESTQPLQEFFGISLSARKVQYKKSQFLPAPLYVLFVQSIAFHDAQDGPSKFIINIGGDVDAAKELVITPEKEAEEDSDSEKEQEDNAEIEVSDRRMLRKHSSVIDGTEDRKKKLIQKHPLWVEWVVRTKGGDAITIQFFYLIKLQIVTVKTHVETDPSTGKISEAIMQSDNVLSGLFPDDFGVVSPNPSNANMFQKVDVEDIAEFLSKIGRPYLWAQKLGGLDFSSLYPRNEIDDVKISSTYAVIQPNMQLSMMNIEKTLKMIRKRLSNQIKLWIQLRGLESRTAKIPDGAKELFPPKNSATLVSWETIDWFQFKAHEYTHDLIEMNAVSEKNMFFKATVERGRAKVTALVSLKMDFPSVPALICIQLEQDGEERHGGNDPSIRDIEIELNVYAVEDFAEWADNMVTLQLHRLLYCTDILLETDLLLGESAGPSEFGREKLLMNPAKGRNLRRPFQYVSSSGYFVQRY